MSAGPVVDRDEAVDPAFQRDIWEIRKAGLNIMMSMKGEGKPVSFIEDCAVALENIRILKEEKLIERVREAAALGFDPDRWFGHVEVGIGDTVLMLADEFPELDASASFPYTPTFDTVADETVKSLFRRTTAPNSSFSTFALLNSS